MTTETFMLYFIKCYNIKSMKPFFSIIIPTLNEEKFLPGILKDLEKQKEKNFETIVVDSFSTDKTKQIALSFSKSLRLRFKQHREKKVAAQRNNGAGLAKGGYLIFFDADVRVSPSFTKRAKRIVVKRKGLMFLPYVSPDNEHKQYEPLFDLVNLLVELSQNLPKKFSLGGTMIIENDFFKLIGGFNEKLFISEDHELLQRASRWGIRVKFIKEMPLSIIFLIKIFGVSAIKFLHKFNNPIIL